MVSPALLRTIRSPVERSDAGELRTTRFYNNNRHSNVVR